MKNYIDKSLKSDSKEDFEAACSDVGLVDSDGQVIKDSLNHCFIIIGTIYRDTGNVTLEYEGYESPVLEAMEGYYVNLRYLEPVGLEALEVEIESPTVVFA